MRQQSDLSFSWQLITTQQQLDEAIRDLAGGSGPLYVDTERASGFTYSNSACLIQIGRKGAPNLLIDPFQINNFGGLAELFASSECVLHAASQDLPCLAELGLTPERLWDTELAARLLGLETASLGGLCELLLNLELEKAYSGVNWSTRPLPEEWLEYACLDIVVLPELHHALASEAVKQGKTDRLTQEFQNALTKKPKPPRAEPWRRVKGLGSLTLPRSRVIALELSRERDAFAREFDIAPSRVLPDSSIIVAAQALPRSIENLERLRGFRGAYSKSEIARWWRAILRAKKAPLDSFKREPLRGHYSGELTETAEDGSAPRQIPPQVQWERRNPAALKRLQLLREELNQAAESEGIEAWLLLDAQTQREVCWEPAGVSVNAITEQLRDLGARDWQITRVAPIISRVFSKIVAK